MAGYAAQDLFAPLYIREVVSRVNPALTTLSRLFGFDVGGSNREQQSGRNFAFDYFDHTREVASGRAPDAASAAIKPQLAGTVQGVFPRSAEMMQLRYEKIFNRRSVGGPTSELDKGGMDWITRQQNYMGERFANIIEFQTAAMLRGSYVFVQDGDKLKHDFSGTGITVDFKIPAGNLSSLNMLGGGNIISALWSNTGTDIPAQIFAINQAMQQLAGFPLKHIVLNSVTWQYVMNNTKVQAQSGTANTPLTEIKQDNEGNFTASMRFAPWIKFHIIDHGLVVGTGAGTYTKLLPDNKVAFLPDPSPLWCGYLDGSEYVTDGPQATTATEQFGFYSYGYPVHDPAAFNMHMLLNGIPALKVRNAIAFGTVG